MNAAGIALVKKFEGCELDAYKCPAGVWTIGYGHTGPTVYPGLRWSQEAAEQVLAKDLQMVELNVAASCTAKPTDNELAAMTSLAFNIGIGAFRKSSVLRCHNAGDINGAAQAFSLWNKAGGVVLPGLVARRAAESALYLEPDQ